MAQSPENVECCGDGDGEPTCYVPLTGLVNQLSRKYTMQLICVIGSHGSLRFREIEEHLPTASTSTISDRLNELVESNLVTRTQYDEIPPRVEYELTHKGGELCERLEPLLEWVDEHGESMD
jgi:DNA-binding HxlR family transcriptional regulator